jgi:DNA-directed RNA polymerase subunit RPC12/RpoP
MQGRYGQDEFYRFLIFAAMVSVVLNLFFRSRILSLLGWILLIYAFFRAFSRNHQARYAENQKYLQVTAKIRYKLEQEKKLRAERKIHHIYTCPKCKQKIRIPKGKGKIMVRCPKCQHEFQRRS